MLHAHGIITGKDHNRAIERIKSTQYKTIFGPLSTINKVIIKCKKFVVFIYLKTNPLQAS